MFEYFKANKMFEQMLKRPDIEKAYAMVGPEDSWYDTITTVHNSLATVREFPHEQWQLVSHDGLKLQALYYPAESSKTMIWVHGYTSHAERESAFPALFYRSLGFNVLIPYLRAHGPSEGKYISFGVLESMDIMGWVERVNEVHPDGDIIIHGLSMGGGTVLDLCDQTMKNVRGLVVDAPSINVCYFLENVTCGFYPKDKHRDKICRHALNRFRREFGKNAEDYNGFEIIKNCKYPMLLSAGSFEEMDEMLETLAHNNPMESTVLILDGCNHGNGMYKQTQVYQDTIRQFISANITER